MPCAAPRYHLPDCRHQRPVSSSGKTPLVSQTDELSRALEAEPQRCLTKAAVTSNEVPSADSQLQIQCMIARAQYKTAMTLDSAGCWLPLSLQPYDG